VAIDSAVIGTEYPAVTADIERGRLRAFAEAIGEQDPLYSDVTAAQAAGHPDLPVPPSFLFGLELDGPDSFGWLAALEVDLRRVLHGEQRFEYHRVAHAGETLTARSKITDVYSKRGGALDFIVRRTAVTAADGSAVADLTSTIVVQNPAGQA
jgi:acyl dehydratase